MKKLITLLLVLVTLNGYSQSDGNKRMVVHHRDSIPFYFKQYLDEYRRTLYPRIPDVIISDTLSYACKHHNNYLANMMLEDGSGMVIMHDEPKESGEFYYRGDDTLINDWSERVRYYDPENSFTHVGEVLHVTALRSHLVKTQKEVAKIILDDWLSSEGHRKTLEMYFYTHIGIDVTYSKKNLFTGVVTSALKSSVPINKFGRKEFLHPGGNIYEDVIELPKSETKNRLFKKIFKKN